MSTFGRDAAPAPARLTHDAAEALISSRLDGPIDPAANRALLAHLATCPTCRAFAEQMEAMSRGLRELPHLPPSPTVSRQVRERLADGLPWWSRLSLAAGNRVGAMQAAAAMLILLGAVATVLLIRLIGDDNGGGTATINPPSITATSRAAVAASASPAPTETPGQVAQYLTPSATRTATPSPTATLVNVQVPVPPTQTATETIQAAELPTETPEPPATEEPAPTETPRPTESATPEPSPTETEAPEPTATETEVPTAIPTESPTEVPTETPAPTRTPRPTKEPTEEPTATPEPTETATAEPTAEPTETEIPPTATATEEPTAEPTEEPTEEPTTTPTSAPTEEPTESPEPTETRTPRPTKEPTQTPTPPIVPRSTAEGGQASEDTPVTDEATEEPTEEPTPEDTTQTQNAGEPTIGPVERADTPTTEPGPEETPEEPFPTSEEGIGSAEITATPEEPTEAPTEEATEEPTAEATEEPSEEAGSPLAQAEVVAAFPEGAGASSGLRFAADGAAFALDRGGQIVVAAADGTVLAALDGLSPVWSPRGLVLLFADGAGGVAVWDRESGQTLSITARTSADTVVVDYPAGWTQDGLLLFLRYLPDDPGQAELHGADWDGSDDQVLWAGELAPLLARPVATSTGVWALTETGWVRIGVDGSVDDPVENPWGGVGDVLTTPFGSAFAFAAGGQLIVVSADNPWVALWSPIAYGGAGFAFSPSGEQLVVADEAGLAIYDLLSGALVGRADGAAVAAPGWSEAGIYFVAQGDPPTLRRIPSPPPI